MTNGFEIQCIPGAASAFDVQASGLEHPEEWFFEAMTWGTSDSGETVNPRTALGHGPLWQAVGTLAGDVGQLPLNIYRRTDKRDPRVVEIDAMHPVDWLLAHEPNAWQTPAVWKETMMAWALLWGNGCSWIIRDGAGRPSQLLPLLPDRTNPIEADGEYWIETDLGDGKRFPIPYSDVFHMRGLATDGFWGLSAVSVCKNVIGGGLALRKHGNKTFRNGARPAGALSVQGAKPTAEQQREYREQVEKIHAGSDNAGRLMILYGGTTYAPMSMSNDDAQWLEAMDLDREFVAGLFFLPPYKLGAMKNSAVRANIEQQNRDYLYTSLSRHLNKAKEEVERKLFNFGERRLGRIYADWDVDVILKADLAARGTYYSQAIAGEWMTKNEVRFEEGLPPLEGGDVTRNPAINPTQPNKPEESPGRHDAPAPAEEARQSARGLIRQQVSALLDMEATAAEKHIPQARNAGKWVDNYHTKYLDTAGNFLETPCKLANALGCEVGDWRGAVASHSRRSLNNYHALAGIATKDSLPEIAKRFADSVRDGKERLTADILGE